MREHLIRGDEMADDLHKVVSDIHDHFSSNTTSLRIQITESSGNGKWGMARLWRKWMQETADCMAANGVTMPLMIGKGGQFYGKRKFNSQDAHELFTSQHLGLNENGERLSWAKSEGANVADKGQRFMAMLKHEEWCQSRGINLTQPRNSELHELKEAQNA